MTETPKEGYCEWTEHEGQPSHTECGHSFEFNEDGIRENKFVFCPYCGGNISVVAQPRHQESERINPFYWCRCVPDCATGMTLNERDEHECSAHPGKRPRKDLDDVPPELRRKTWA